MTEIEPASSIVESVRVARERLGLELRAQADHILKLSQELAELQQLHQRTEQEASRQWDEIAHAAAVAAEAAAAAAAMPKVSPDTALENLLTAVRNLMTCTMPDQLFEVLTEEAADWGVRAAIFDVRGKAAWGASAHGFGPGLSEKALRSLIVQLKQDNPFRQVCETAAHVDASAETLKKNRNVLDKFKPAPHAPILLLPIRSAGTVTAIFYADPGAKGLPLPVDALKVLAEFAGAQIDRLIALSGGFSEEGVEEEVAETPESLEPVEEAPVEVAPEQPAEPHAEEPAPVEPVAAAPVQVEPVVEEPEHVESVVEQTLYGRPLVYEPVRAEPPAAEPVQVEPVAEEPAGEQLPVPEPPAEVPVIGATVGEVHTEVEVVEPPVPEPELPPPPVGAAVEPLEPVAATVESVPSPPVVVPPVEVVAPPPPPEAPPPETVAENAPPLPPAAPAVFDVTQLSEAEQKVHKDARRFAKLLVSEIDLYNKGKVAEGRKNQDLYKRLKSDIDRSRQTFEKRFGKVLSKQVDYFHDELVKTLALNDVAVLGPEYPGPSV